MVQTFLQLLDKVVGSAIGGVAGTVSAVKVAIDALKQGSLPSLKEMGEAFATEFKIGFGQTVFEDFLLDVLDETTKLALAKQKAAVEELRKKGKETTEAAPLPTEEAFVGPPAPPPLNLEQFEMLKASLKEEAELLKLTNAEREIQEGLLEAEAQLKFDLTGATEEEVLALLRNNQALATQAELLEAIKGPQLAFERGSEALKVLLDAGKISIDEYSKKLKELQETLKQSERGGRGLGDVLKGAFDKSRDALSNFIRSGKIEFTQLADSILADLARIAAQKAILKLFEGPLGFLPGFQEGGGFTIGGAGGPDSKVVAFRGTPGEQVTITPPGEQPAQAAAPQITIVNVTDPSEIPEVMAAQEGQQVIINTIQRNPTVIRQAIS
jgi:hypothetical protein